MGKLFKIVNNYLCVLFGIFEKQSNIAMRKRLIAY